MYWQYTTAPAGAGLRNSIPLLVVTVSPDSVTPVWPVRSITSPVCIPETVLLPPSA